MHKKLFVGYEEYSNSDELNPDDRALLDLANNILQNAYAPYSQFYVGAAARLDDGSIYTGTNQENASYPVSICAEQSLLIGITTRFKNFRVTSLAVSYDNLNGSSNEPISPCGKCRQFLNEFETRIGFPIRIIMGSKSGPVIVVNSALDLLPFAFGNKLLAE